MWNGGKCGTSCTGDDIRGVDSRTLCAVRHDFLCGGGYNDDYNMIYWSIVIVKREGAVKACVGVFIPNLASIFSRNLFRGVNRQGEGV
jgi:hypothetical protein